MGKVVYTGIGYALCPYHIKTPQVFQPLQHLQSAVGDNAMPVAKAELFELRHSFEMHKRFIGKSATIQSCQLLGKPLHGGNRNFSSLKRGKTLFTDDIKNFIPVFFRVWTSDSN